jgi:hypothetical protein
MCLSHVGADDGVDDNPIGNAGSGLASCYLPVSQRTTQCNKTCSSGCCETLFAVYVFDRTSELQKIT